MPALRSIQIVIEGKSAKLVKAIKAAETKMSKFKKGAGKAFGAVQKAAKGLAIGGAAAIAGFAVAGIKHFADLGDELDKMSKRTGFSVEALGELKFAAEQSGTGIESIEKASKRMASTILDAGLGLKSTTDALDALGLNVKDLEGLKPEEQFQIFAEALAGVEDASKKAALAQDIFGRSGTELLPLFNSGAEGMEALRKQAQDLGVVMSTDAAKGAADFKDAQNELKSALAGVAMDIGKELLPRLTKLARWFVKKLPDIRNFFVKVLDQAKPFFAAFKRGVETIFPILKNMFNFVINNKPVLIAAIAGIGAIIATSLGPVSLAAVAIAGIITAIGFLRDNWEQVWGAIKDAFDRVAGTIMRLYESHFGWLLPAGPLVKAILFFKDHWETIWSGVLSTTETIVNGVVDGINKLIGAYNKIPFLPDLPKIPSLELAADRGARDGLVTAIQSSEVSLATSRMGLELERQVETKARMGIVDAIGSAEVSNTMATTATTWDSLLEDASMRSTQKGIKDGTREAIPLAAVSLENAFEVAVDRGVTNGFTAANRKFHSSFQRTMSRLQSQANVFFQRTYGHAGFSPEAQQHVQAQQAADTASAQAARTSQAMRIQSQLAHTPTSGEAGRAAEHQVPININFNGDVYGAEDFQDKIDQARLEFSRRGG